MNQAINEFFIRPQRQTYYSFDLGPNIFHVGGKKCIRQDFSIANVNGYNIVVSFYHFDELKYENCVIYLHTHHGSKLQAVSMVESVLSIGLNLCLFDFAGYGNSGGQTVTLGCKEIWDIECVINHLSSKFEQHHFILWGRSMGAVAALLYNYTKSMIGSMQLKQQKNGQSKMSKQSKVIGGIYDSPFYSLQKLTLELGSKNSKVPEVILKPFVYFLKNSLKDQINFEDLELIQKMEVIKLPGAFITSKNDKFINFQHSELLYKSYGGKKQLVYIEKDHNQSRKDEDLHAIFDFIKDLNNQYPKRWQKVLMNNLNYIKSQGKNAHHLYFCDK